MPRSSNALTPLPLFPHSTITYDHQTVPVRFCVSVLGGRSAPGIPRIVWAEVSMMCKFSIGTHRKSSDIRAHHTNFKVNCDVALAPQLVLTSFMAYLSKGETLP